MDIINANHALALAASCVPEPDYSALFDSPYFVLEHDSELSRAERQTLIPWLRRLACPVIGIAAPDVDDEFSRAFDVRVETAEAAAKLVPMLEQCPIAATVLVQTLRITEAMPLEDALDVESLAYATLQGGAEYARWLEANRAPAPFQATDDGPAVELNREDDSLLLTLNRASNRNAMSVEMRDALNEAMGLAQADESIAGLRIEGRGRCFSTGGDLTEFGTVPDTATGHIVRSLSVPGRLLARCTARLGDAAQAHVHGACIGSGIEFPAFAGRVTAAKNAYFQLPEVGMGLIPGAGGTISIARRMGRQRTAWLALSGKRLPAKKALEWGLVDEIVELGVGHHIGRSMLVINI